MTSTPIPSAGFSWRILGLVALGGALGAMARAALLWPVMSDLIGTTVLTAAINVVGAFGLGIVVGATGARHPHTRAFLGTGMLGGFTTFSAFAVQVVTSVPWVSVLLALGTTALGVVVAGAGLRVGRGLVRRRDGKDAPDAPEISGATQ